jgi:hypothetical protein
MSSDIWWDSETNPESLADSTVRGGSLSDHGRESAVRDALPIIGRFFQSQGQSGQLVASAGISVNDGIGDDLDLRLLAALRLRSALAAATPLLSEVEDIAVRPTFRYALRTSESVGHLSGTLDVPKYVSRNYWDGGPPTYPVTSVFRSSKTPENVLVAYSALWMQRELSDALDLSGAPPRSPEAQTVAHLHGSFERVLSSPALVACRSTAAEILWRGAEESLFNDAENRLRRGEVAHDEPYRAVLESLRRLREVGPTGLSGSQLWSFYDERFDTRLFELWCSFSVATALSNALATDVPPVDPNWNGTGLTFTWQRPNGILELYMQKSLHLIDSSKHRRWKLKGTDVYLRGIPDIVVRGLTHEGVSRWAILDAKLRQRTGPPTEELYKILGYFGHYMLEHDAQGAILFHTPHETSANVREYTTEQIEDSRLIATGLNPSDRQQSLDGLTEVTDMLLSLLSLPPARPNESSVSHQEAYIARLIDEMKSAKGEIAPASLDASRRRLRALLGNQVWEYLGTDICDMLATGEHVGFTLDPDGDFSGPVLSLVAPLEILLHEHLWQPATVGLSRRETQNRNTLGGVIDAVEQALSGRVSVLSEAIRREVHERSLSTVALQNSLESLRAVNRDFRRRAAHKEKLTSHDWNDAFRRVISRDRVLPSLLKNIAAHRSSEPGAREVPTHAE